MMQETYTVNLNTPMSINGNKNNCLINTKYNQIGYFTIWLLFYLTVKYVFYIQNIHCKNVFKL